MNRLFSSLSNSTALALALLVLPPGHAAADSLWKQGSFQSIAADKKAHCVGDILTVLINENNGATRQNDTTTHKTASANAAITSFLYGPAASGLLTKGGSYPALKYNTDTEFDGGGKIGNQETINAQMAVRVIDVLPNGNMVIEGTLRTAFSGEKQDAIVRGTVRPDDISASNTLLSFNIADATIQFISKGVVSDNQKRGWFTTLWDKLSPF